MTDAEKADRLARVLWWAHWDGQPPYEWDAEPGRATDWRNAATAALTWLDSLEDGPDYRFIAKWWATEAGRASAERDALRAEVERLRGALEWGYSGDGLDDLAVTIQMMTRNPFLSSVPEPDHAVQVGVRRVIDKLRARAALEARDD